MKQQLKKSLLILALVLTGVSCKKVTAPNDASKELFGSWTYDSNTGGFTGAGGSNRFSEDAWVEFTESGSFKVYVGSVKQSQKDFTLELKESIYDVNPRTTLVYDNGEYETYQISNDTLYLSDEMFDGYTYRFIRK
ncbi:MAG: hypothetical protein RLZ33_1812 [Bacteroidota bacterium]|jgi:hypothetical protein